jgi:hypothetical protein
MHVKLVDWPAGLSLNEIVDIIVLRTGKCVDFDASSVTQIFQPLPKGSRPILDISPGNEEDISILKREGVILEEM